MWSVKWRSFYLGISVLMHGVLGDAAVIFHCTIVKQLCVTDILSISYEITLGWMTEDLRDDESTVAHAMAWCHQAPSHYLNQCWPKSVVAYGVARPQWVNDDLLSNL